MELQYVKLDTSGPQRRLTLGPVIPEVVTLSGDYDVELDYSCAA